jgi:condensin-2 complex subunit H2
VLPSRPVSRRDLAQNWNIDVAKDLVDYLDELETIEVSFDGGKSTMNFAEAALLIQVREEKLCA